MNKKNKIMKIRLFIFLFFLLIVSLSKAQRDPKTHDYLNEMIRSIDYRTSNLEKEIAGEYYLNDWSQGYIYPKNHKSPISKYLIRYFVYKQEFHLVTPQKDTVLLGKSHPVDSIIADDKTFVQLPVISNNNVSNNYFEVLVSGRIKLLKRYSCVFVQGNEKSRSGYEKLVPDSYKIKTKLYYQVGNEPIEILPSNKSKQFQLFQDFKMKQFVHQHKLKTKSEEHLIRIFKHFNTLN